MDETSIPDLLVFDGWVSDPLLLEQLHELVVQDPGASIGQAPHERSRWWNGEQASSPVHRYIASTAQRLGRWFDLPCVAYEWRVRRNEAQPWYQHRDERLFAETRELRHPLLATELCLSGSDVIQELGGAFAVNTDDTGKTADQVYPMRNRLLVFPGSRVHCVREFQGQRLGLLVNFWDQVPRGFTEESR